MGSEERFNWGWRWLGRIAGRQSTQELEKLLASSGGESIGRMANNVGVKVLPKVKPNRQSARIRIGIIIRYQRKPGGVGEAYSCRGRLPLYMRRPGEGSGVGRRRKSTSQHSAFGMGWSKAGVQSEDGVELLKQILTQRNKLVIFGKWHG